LHCCKAEAPVQQPYCTPTGPSPRSSVTDSREQTGKQNPAVGGWRHPNYLSVRNSPTAPIHSTRDRVRPSVAAGPIRKCSASQHRVWRTYLVENTRKTYHLAGQPAQNNRTHAANAAELDAKRAKKSVFYSASRVGINIPHHIHFLSSQHRARRLMR